MSLPIAVQLYSIRDAVASDFDGTLKTVKEMGYDGVELAGLYGKTPAEIKAMCEKYGLTPVSAHVGYGKLDIKGIVDTCENTGIEWLVIEQDDPDQGRTSLECAKLCIDRLKELI